MPGAADRSSILAQLSSAAATLSAQAAGGSGGGGGGDAAEPRGGPTGRIRVVNAFEDGGRHGGPIDLYDVLRPSASDKPIIADLQYGQVSDYVSPRAGDPGGPSNLWIYPAGTRQPAGAYDGQNLSNAGWGADEQVTVVIGPSSVGSGSISEAEISDGQSTENPLPTASAPAGQATLRTKYADGELENEPNLYLTVDGVCARAIDVEDQNSPTALAEGSEWALTPGAHDLGLLTSPPGQGLTSEQCAAAAKKPATTVRATASAGGRIDLIAFGSDTATLAAAVAPVS